MRHLFLIPLLLLSGCTARFSEPLEITFEARAPKTRSFDPLTKFDLATDEGSSGTRLRLTQRREEGQDVVFSWSFLVYKHQRRRALIISFESQEPSQVFVILIPKPLSTGGWSAWIRPSYMGDSQAKKALEPTITPVTTPSGAGVAPAPVVAHL